MTDTPRDSADWNSETVLGVVLSVIADVLEVDDPSTISPQASLTELGADSLARIEAVERLEEHFGEQVRFDDGDFEELLNLQDAVDLILQKLRGE